MLDGTACIRYICLYLKHSSGSYKQGGPKAKFSAYHGHCWHSVLLWQVCDKFACYLSVIVNPICSHRRTQRFRNFGGCCKDGSSLETVLRQMATRSDVIALY